MATTAEEYWQSTAKELQDILPVIRLFPEKETADDAAALGRAIAKLKQSVTNLQTLETQLADARAKLSHINADVADAEGRVKSLEDKHLDLEKTITSLQPDLDHGREQLATLQSNSASVTQELWRLEGAETSIEASFNARRKEFQDAEASCAQLSELSRIHQDEIQTLESFRAEDRQSADELAEQLVELSCREENLNELQQAHDKQQEDLTALYTGLCDKLQLRVNLNGQPPGQAVAQAMLKALDKLREAKIQALKDLSAKGHEYDVLNLRYLNLSQTDEYNRSAETSKVVSSLEEELLRLRQERQAERAGLQSTIRAQSEKLAEKEHTILENSRAHQQRLDAEISEKSRLQVEVDAVKAARRRSSEVHALELMSKDKTADELREHFQEVLERNERRVVDHTHQAGRDAEARLKEQAKLHREEVARLTREQENLLLNRRRPTQGSQADSSKTRRSTQSGPILAGQAHAGSTMMTIPASSTVGTKRPASSGIAEASNRRGSGAATPSPQGFDVDEVAAHAAGCQTVEIGLDAQGRWEVQSSVHIDLEDDLLTLFNIAKGKMAGFQNISRHGQKYRAICLRCVCERPPQGCRKPLRGLHDQESRDPYHACELCIRRSLPCVMVIDSQHLLVAPPA